MLQVLIDGVVVLLVGRLLLSLACWLWEIYFTKFCIDASCPLPLPPGNMGWPVLGETVKVLKDSSYSSNARKKFGNVYRSHMLGVPVVRIAGGENLRRVIHGEGDIVTQQYPKAVQSLLGDKCLVTQRGGKHDVLHRIVRKCFTQEVMESFIPHMQEVLQDQFLKRWCDRLGSFGAWSECRRLVFKVACYTMVGFEYGDKEVDSLYKHFINFITGFFTIPLALPGSTYNEAMKSRHVIREHVKKSLKGETDNPNSIIRQILEADEECRDEEACVQLCTELMSFGHETTSGTFTSLVYLLAKHPEVARRLRAEIDEHYSLDPMTSKPLTFAELNKMAYLNAVVKESMRVLPPVAGVYRKVLKTFELEGYQIPKGWYVTLLIRDTHESTEAFYDKATFDPDRWLHNNNNEVHENLNHVSTTVPCPETKSAQNRHRHGHVMPKSNGVCPASAGTRENTNSRESHVPPHSESCKSKSAASCPYDYIPFGRGKRMCVGKDYAMMALKVFTIELLRNCDWVVHNPDTVFDRVPSLRPVDGLPVTFNRLMKTMAEE